MLKDLGHPYAHGEPVYDITFENVQAGERTSHLFRLANFNDAHRRRHRRPERAGAGLVHLRRGRPHVALQRERQRAQDADRSTWCAGSPKPGRPASSGPDVLLDILEHRDQPGAGARASRRAARPEHRGRRSARTSCTTSTCTTSLRFGFAPSKVAFLAHDAWHDRGRRGLARWAAGAAPRTTAWPTSRRHLRTFVWRFFKTSQFKRSCVPNAPKVGSGGSLSPRGDWRAPSDGEASAWLADLERIPDA